MEISKEPQGQMSKEAWERISSAANSLYEEAGHAAFPTVDSVRRRAKVNMNDASAGMKEWRRAQTTRVAPVAVQIPETVQNASALALATLWHEAQELANESLRAAQIGWEAERIEAQTLNMQIGDAYEALSLNFDAAQQDVSTVRMNLEQSEAIVQDLQVELETANVALAASKAASVTAEARTVEIKHRADELRAELDHAHQDASQARGELVAMRQAHQVEVEALRAAMLAQQARADDTIAKSEATTVALRSEQAVAHAKAEDAARTAAGVIETLRTDLATARAKVDAAQDSLLQERAQAAAELQRLVQQVGEAKTERDQAMQTATQAREEAAALRGKMDAIADQNSQLMQTLKSAQAKGASNI
ncbi:DNA-binding protein [Massilia sp. TSP1-1-2]|uniref:DNA-binding protein n=1 Tax=Massilia sp. TSP1-1-2 TaxID=2804649 RepID=UPI003CF3D63A